MTPRAERQGSHRTNAILRWAGLTGGGGVGVVALLMLTAPFASAAPVMVMAPFTVGQAVHSGTPTVQGIGAQLQIRPAPNFDTANGAASVGAVAIVLQVTNAPALSTYTAKVGLGMVPYFPTTTGPHTISAKWSVGYQARLVANPPANIATSSLSVGVAVRATLTVIEQSSGNVMPGGISTVTVTTVSLARGMLQLNVAPVPVLFRPVVLSLQSGAIYLVTTEIVVTVTVLAAASAATGAFGFASILLAPPKAATLGWIQMG